jgi:TIR domain
VVVARVFISYNREDRSYADRLAAALRDQGHDVWADAFMVGAGDSLVQRIEGGMTGTSFLVLLFSSAPSSPWMDREWMWALSRQLHQAHVRILPVRLAGGTVPSILADTSYVDLATDWQHGVDVLAEAIGSDVASSPARATVSLIKDRRDSSPVPLQATGSGDDVSAIEDEVPAAGRPQPSGQLISPKLVREPQRRPLWRAFTDGVGETFDVFGAARESRGEADSRSTFADDVHAVCLALGLVAEVDYGEGT